MIIEPITANGMFRCGFLRLAPELDRLLEAEVGEHDATGRDRRQDALDSGGREAVAGGEVRGAERGHDQDHDRQDRDRDLPPDDRRVASDRRRTPSRLISVNSSISTAATA